ncbi:hypothetical protein HUU05_22200 [candidate division KSB1 bacterium]|nr:hypothetical protein [candidate division KSB1 bacterium]
MKKLFAALLLLAVAAHAQTAREIFAPFTATWKGVFKIYTHDGRLLDQIEIEQHYWWEGNVQRATFVEKNRDGKVTRAQARNYEAQNKLYCAVEKDSGEKSLHQGHYEDGALFWFRKEEGKMESFKERVVLGVAGKEYHIDGFGVYGSGKDVSHLLFEGRYFEVKKR